MGFDLAKNPEADAALSILQDYLSPDRMAAVKAIVEAEFYEVHGSPTDQFDRMDAARNRITLSMDDIVKQHPHWFEQETT